MVDSLELQAAVEMVKLQQTFNVCSRAELVLRKGLHRFKIRRQHASVQESEPHVQEHRRHTRDSYESSANILGWQRALDQHISEQRLEACLQDKLDSAHLQRSTKLRGTW